MKLKLLDVCNLYEAFCKISEIKVPSRVQYWILRNDKWIKENYKFFIEERQKYIVDYLIIDETGHFGKMDKDTGNIELFYKNGEKEKYDKCVSDLLNMEIQVDPYLLDYEKVMNESPSFELEPKYLLTLSPLIM